MLSSEMAPPVASAALAEQLDILADRLVVASRNHPEVCDAGSLLGAVDRIIASVVQLLMSTMSSGVVAAEGMTTASWLRAVAGRSGADAGMLLAAAERLADMPAVWAWFTDGTLSWSTVRGIVAATRNLTVAQRRWVDATLAADPGRMARLDADQAIAAVTRLADAARPELQRDRAQRSFQRQFLTLQPAFDGSGQMYAEMDAETTAIALQALTDLITDPDDDGDGDDHRDGETQPAGSMTGPGRGRSNLEAFKTLCQLRLNRKRTPNTHSGHDDAAEVHGGDDNDDSGEDGGGDHVLWGVAPSAARPSMLVVTDLAMLIGDGDQTNSATAQLLWRTDRAPIELTAEAVRRLACDATLRHVLVDGAQVLGVGATHPKVSATLRAALEVRDGGCRFTACRRPAAVCENHHIIPKAQGGPTALTNLALLCMAHHHAVHEGRWHATLHPDASMTFTRRGVTLTSLPRADQHSAQPASHPAADREKQRPRTTANRHRPARPTHHTTCPSKPNRKP